METRPLGRSGLHVSAIGLGGMPMSLAGRPSEAESIRVIHAALDAGMTLIDTADVYCVDDRDVGHNERLIARALDGRRGVTVATKGGLARPNGAWVRNGRPAHLKRACEASLRALAVEAIDLYQLHAPDDRVPFAEQVGALAELRAAGKVRHVGLSNVSVAQIREAQEIVPIASVQNRFNPFDRGPLVDGVLEHCAREGIALLAYSPVGGGRGKARVAESEPLRAVAARHAVSPFQVALAWLLAQSPVVIPIPGASKVASAVDSAAAARLQLTDEDRADLRTHFA